MLPDAVQGAGLEALGVVMAAVVAAAAAAVAAVGLLSGCTT